MPDYADSGWVVEMVEYARSRVPFYREHLAGVDPRRFDALPTFDKRMTSGHGRFPISVDGAAGAHRVLATSGTSGDRLCVAFDRKDWARVAARMEVIAQHAGLGASDVLLNTHCYGLWVGGPALDLLANVAGAGLVPVGPAPPAVVLSFLADGVGTAISATPSYLRRLLETAEATGQDLRNSSLRLGFIGAESAEQSLRTKLQAKLPDGFRWVELYGLTETAGPPVAFGPDPAAPELRVHTRDFVAEVLDREHDVPVERGAVGELTLTTRAVDLRTPLIRYRTRDLARVTEGDPSAPTRISRILGRADDALKVGGVLVYPSAVAEIVSELLPASAEWRAMLRRREPDDEMFIEAEADHALCIAVANAFRDRVGLTVSVDSVAAGSLHRSREKTQRILVESSALASVPA
ncbi:AMP-binding protein [Solirubrobacter taibaiensis]|nr:AMP-binding protein [Solirubrobacter taibaiensis]